MTFAEALAKTVRALEPRAGASATAEAERILDAASRRAEGRALSRLELYARGREPVPAPVAIEAEHLSLLRASGHLLQHVIGWQEFLDHEYRVDPSVLIPRPETECLARAAIEVLRAGETSRAKTLKPARGLEVGLGSGILSIELLAAFPELEMTASELSAEAAAIAAANVETILKGASRLHIVRPRHAREIWEPFGAGEHAADFLVSNPPYLLKGEAEDDVAASEPACALWAPKDDPLHFYRGIARGAADFLIPGGWVFLEVPPERAAGISELFSPPAGPIWKVEIKPDLTGRPRVLVARLLNQAVSESGD